MSDLKEVNENTAFEMSVRDIIAGMHFCRPGIIDAFYPDTNRVDVTPAIMSKLLVNKGVKYEMLPRILDVPIAIPYSQKTGLALTMPIEKGDECLLVFCDRYIDRFADLGGFQAPEEAGQDALITDPRMHHLTDAICIPGFVTKPNRLPDWNNEAIELRDKDRKVYVSVSADGVESTDGEAIANISGGRVDVTAPNGVRMTDGQARITIQNGAIDLVAPNGLGIDAPNIQVGRTSGEGWVRGILRALNFIGDSGFNANTHRHNGVEQGGGTSGTFV